MNAAIEYRLDQLAKAVAEVRIARVVVARHVERAREAGVTEEEIRRVLAQADLLDDAMIAEYERRHQMVDRT